MTVISSVTAFVTWLTLGLSNPEPALRIAVSLIVFIAVEATLIHYVISCMRRHCRHQPPTLERNSGLGAQS
jgi:hypothetical protein